DLRPALVLGHPDEVPREALPLGERLLVLLAARALEPLRLPVGGVVQRVDRIARPRGDARHDVAHDVFAHRVEAEDGGLVDHRASSFALRTFASTSAGSPPPKRAANAGSTTRRNGLWARSRPIVDGTVGAPRARSSAAQAIDASTAALSGSTLFANRRLDWVYSCPHHTRTWSGSAPSAPVRLRCMSAGVPSKR